MTAFTVCLAVVGLVPVVYDAVDELCQRRRFAAEMEHAWHAWHAWRPEPRVVRPGRVRPVLLRLRRRVDRQIELLAAEEAWHERRVREVRRALCVWERRRDLVDARIELEAGR